ncbi:IS66 family insertion sequence hypothetical protein [Agrobacterium vitis]|uniref:Transposase n=1 Tax=Agrobacterium vitis TaxID=373 RepID=A0A368P078_AGRVI|nr:transposase [Agrobacterium vitis]KAA3505428.1 IS66 family insertion sequence hypothetical protein [Agrobacterium vitis]KAA3519319.1 IS66 family insertion sequence hypothetical protein [Agrobacterium vitis]MCF1480331.1 IS66 family insertion sequence hypothetical protein [Agrobacterium vitis]MUZ99700.1 IS66 family insertion sequence hypothetical protein [Agrobacterium vitis]MVA32515.1 IS66 family insertion sequence hypothetical protein [Agrobacterium vitis]
MGRMEILTGVKRRRDWSDDDKLSILEGVAVDGARIVDVARRHDIHPQQIYSWRRKFAAAQTNPVVSFLPVARSAADKPAALRRSVKPMRIEIGCKGGRVLKVEADIAPDVLKALIRSVEEA